MDKLNQWTGAADMVGQVVNLRTDYRMESEWILILAFDRIGIKWFVDGGDIGRHVSFFLLIALLS